MQYSARLLTSLPQVFRAASRPADEPKAAERAPPVWIAWAYFSVLGAIALALFVLHAPRLEGQIEVFIALALLSVLSEHFPIEIYGDTYISAGLVSTLAIIMLFGAAGAVLVAPLEAISGLVGRRPLSYLVLTNASLFIVVYWAAAGAYGLFAPVNPQEVSWSLAPGAAAATVVSFSLTALLLAVSALVRAGKPFSSSWESHKWIAPHYAAFGVIGLSIAAASIALGVPGILAFVTPALMMRWAMKQYVDKTTENVQKLSEQNLALRAANVEIRRVSEELRETYDGTLEALVTALDARDQETKGHSVRVARYMLTIASAFGVKEGTQEWLDMQRGALLHDVGKIGVRDSILLKPSKLDPDEWRVMMRHPEIGYNMLKEVRFLEGAAEIVLAHHERWDGKGYPRGLREDEIPLGSRIFSVVDTFDSMTTNRPYRKALTTQEALKEILRCGGSQFDPLVVEAFLDIYDDWVRDRRKLIEITVTHN
jgi:putative nucleotidyltransferase with HDIG domain